MIANGTRPASAVLVCEFVFSCYSEIGVRLLSDSSLVRDRLSNGRSDVTRLHPLETLYYDAGRNILVSLFRLFTKLMPEGLSVDAYDALKTTAATHRALVVIRLAGESGLRTGEIPRIEPNHLHQSGDASTVTLLSVPTEATPAGETLTDMPRSENGESTAEPPVDRVTVVPSSLVAELHRYADTMGLDETEPFVNVSARRIQMIVSETAKLAAEQTDGMVPADLSPRDLRATFARRLLVEHEMCPQAVRDAGGWESLGSLDAYLEPLTGEEIGDAFAAAVRDEETAMSTSAVNTDHTAPGVGRLSHASHTAITRGFEALADASDGDDVNPVSTVATALAATDRWDEAWVVREWGDQRPGEILHAAGVDPETLTERGVVDTTDAPPWSDAVDENRPAVIADGHTSGATPTVAAPIRYRGVTHGVLCVGAASDTPVTETERRTLGALAQCVGWAVTATRWHDLLHSDSVTEVEFRTTDESALLTRLSAALDCRVELASTVVVDAGAARFYLDVAGASPHDLDAVVETTAGASDLRVRETRDDGCSVSVHVENGSAVRALTEHGGTVRSATAENGRLCAVADLPAGADVRPVARGLREQFPDARLTSKESVVRSPVTDRSLREGVADRFTDRQWAALQAAYHGGYFDWPRGSTAEEVADVMGVSSPTFHNHLRKAQRALLDGLFEAQRSDTT